MKQFCIFAAVVAFSLLAEGCGRPKKHPSDAGPLITNQMVIQQARRALDEGLTTNPVPEGIPKLFDFVTTNTTLQQVVDRVGPCDVCNVGSNMISYEYDFPDGLFVILVPEWPLQARNRIQWVDHGWHFTKTNKPAAGN